jgi:predicted Zn-ribbon and HTH transcriptional regulator
MNKYCQECGLYFKDDKPIEEVICPECGSEKIDDVK